MRPTVLPRTGPRDERQGAPAADRGRPWRRCAATVSVRTQDGRGYGIAITVTRGGSALLCQCVDGRALPARCRRSRPAQSPLSEYLSESPIRVLEESSIRVPYPSPYESPPKPARAEAGGWAAREPARRHVAATAPLWRGGVVARPAVTPTRRPLSKGGRASALPCVARQTARSSAAGRISGPGRSGSGLVRGSRRGRRAGAGAGERRPPSRLPRPPPRRESRAAARHDGQERAD